MPPGQGLQPTAPMLEKRPGGQAWHAVSEGRSANVPAMHWLGFTVPMAMALLGRQAVPMEHGVQIVEPALLAKEPAGHALQETWPWPS